MDIYGMDIDPRNDVPPELVEQRKRGVTEPNMDELESINLGTNELPRIVKIGKTLSPVEKEKMISLLKANIVAFAWSYEDMPGIDPNIVQHYIPTNSLKKPVK